VGDLGVVIPSDVFATSVLGGQASVSLLGVYGVVGTSLAGTLSGVATAPPFATVYDFGHGVTRLEAIADPAVKLRRR
jgi:hypothetical protein